MKKLYSIVLFCTIFLIAQSVQSQSIGEVECKSQGGTGKLKGKPKKVFVNGFTVHYQFYNKKVKSSKGGFADGILKGSSKADMFLGLDNLTEQDFQDVTNELFNNFKSEFEAKGYEIMSGEGLENVGALEGRSPVKVTSVMYDKYSGVVSVMPSDHLFYTDNSSVFKPNYTSKLSKDLGDAVVANIELFVFFVEDKNSWARKNTKSEIKVETQLRLVAYDNIKAVNEKKISKFRAATIGKSKQVDIFAQSKVELICGRAPIGGSAEVAFTGTLKNDVKINDAYEAEKVSSYAKTDYDNRGMETAFGKSFSTTNTEASTSLVIDVDVEKYKKAVEMAGDSFIKCQIDKFTK